MQGQTRVRQFLAGAHADRAPFLAFTTELSASLARVSVLEMFADPRVLTEAFVESSEVFGLDAVVLRPPAGLACRAIAETPGPDAPFLAPLLEGIRRLRVLLGDRVGIVLALPGPLTLARVLGRPTTVGDLDCMGAGLLATAQFLEPPLLDCLALFESEPLAAEDAVNLRSATSMFWNVARYYSMPSLLIAQRSGPEIASSEATAVAVLAGADPSELEAAGVTRMGIPVPVRPGPDLDVLPTCGFYITAEELPADVDVESVQALTARLRETSTRASDAVARREE